MSGTKLLQQCFRAVKGRDSDLGTSFRVDATVSDGTGLEHRAYLAMFSCQICTLVFATVRKLGYPDLGHFFSVVLIWHVFAYF